MKGQFWQRGKKWYVKIDVGRDPKTGRRKQRTKGGFTRKKDAETWAANLISGLDKGTYIEKSGEVFKDFADQWLKGYSKTVKVSTVRIRNHEIERLKQVIDNIPIQKITHHMYQKAIDELSTKYSIRSVKGMHVTARMIFKKAKQLDLIAKDPTEFAILPQNRNEIKEEMPRFLEKDKLGHFLTTTKEHGLDMDYVLFTTLAYSGMRLGEALALKKTDIDFTNHYIHVRKTLYMPNNNMRQFQLLPPKNKNSKRDIKMDARIIQLLKQHLIEQNEWALALRETYYNDNFVFANSKGYPKAPRHVGDRFKRMLKIAHLDHSLGIHSLRHTHVSLLVESGVGIKEIMERLGHADMNTTLKIYSHLTKDMEQKTAQQFSELLDSYHKM